MKQECRSVTTEERLDGIFDDLMPGETVPIRERTRSNTSSWDSLCQLNLIIYLEEEFSIALSDDDVQDVNSYALALAIIDELTAGN